MIPLQPPKKQYGPRKWEEFKRFCEFHHSNQPNNPVYFISAEKVQNFIYYQCCREKRKVGGMKSGQKHAFDPQDCYARIVKAQVEWLNSYSRGTADKSSKPVPLTTLAQYRAAIRAQWEIHAQAGHNKLRWEEIWTVGTEQLLKSAPKLVPGMKKKNHLQKIEKDLAPYTLVKAFQRIETHMWERGQCSSGTRRDREDNRNIKSALAWIKHRYTFLHSTHSILRCGSLFNGELSDFLLLRVPGNPHEIWIVIQQL
jgi:hypothetical protein